MTEVEGEIREEEQLDPEREAEREARRQLALAQIRQYPDSVLRMKAPPVETFDDDLKRLATRLGELMKDANGVGLDEEGCLSIQGVTMPVERATSVRIEGRDASGGEVAYDLEGTPARIVQHELDHLDGTMILDRTTPEARREALAALRPRLVIR